MISDSTSNLNLTTSQGIALLFCFIVFTVAIWLIITRDDDSKRKRP
jgi:hypothetical protein